VWFYYYQIINCYLYFLDTQQKQEQEIQYSFLFSNNVFGKLFNYLTDIESIDYLRGIVV